MLCDEKPRERYKKKGYIDIRENMNNKSKSNLEVSCHTQLLAKIHEVKKVRDHIRTG